MTAGVGYHMDEALYVESAVFLLRGGTAPPYTPDLTAWVATHGRRWPLMIIPYVGTTKALAALPLFAVFGAGPEVARFSGVLLGCLGIAGLAGLIGKRVSPIAGAAAGGVLAVHPSYLDFTVFDNGGVSVWMASMGLLALALNNSLSRRSGRSAFRLGLTAGCGLWARLNLLWLLAALIVAALFVVGRRVLSPREHWRPLAAGAFLGALPLLVYEAGSRWATLRYIESARRPLSLQGVALRVRALAELMISDSEQRQIWSGPPLPTWEIALGGCLLVLVFLCLFVRIPSQDRIAGLWRRAFAASTIVLTGILMTSGLTVSPHHLVAVLPLAAGTLAIFALEAARRFRTAAAWATVAGAGLVALFLFWDLQIDRGLRQTRGRGLWSSAIDDAGRSLRSHPVPFRRLKILQWGLQNNLYVGTGGAVYGTELYWNASQQRSSRGMSWPDEIREGGSFLLFSFPTGSEALEAAAVGFGRALQAYQGPRRDESFRDRAGSPVVLLVDIPPSH